MQHRFRPARTCKRLLGRLLFNTSLVAVDSAGVPLGKMSIKAMLKTRISFRSISKLTLRC